MSDKNWYKDMRATDRAWGAGDADWRSAYRDTKGAASKGGTSALGGFRLTAHCAAKHRGARVAVGDTFVYIGAGHDMDAVDVTKMQIVFTLAESVFAAAAKAQSGDWGGSLVYAPMRDYGTWDPKVLKTQAGKVLSWCRAGHKVLICCAGGHGRTGTLLAAMIALAEPDTADPVAAARARGCRSMIETRAQEASVFCAVGREVPAAYAGTFLEPPPKAEDPLGALTEAARDYAEANGALEALGAGAEEDEEAPVATGGVVECPYCWARIPVASHARAQQNGLDIVECPRCTELFEYKAEGRS